MRSTIFIALLSTITFQPLLFAHNFYSNNSYTEAEAPPNRIPAIESSFDTEYAEKFVANFNLDKPDDYPFQDVSDAAVYLTQLGKTQKALDLLQHLHNQHPKEYKITANLGVTHELKGDLDSAEHYIREALKLSPQSAPTTDWVNLKILAAKRSIKKDPDWLLNNQVLNLNWNTDFYNNRFQEKYTAQQQDSLRLVRYQTYQNQFDTLWHVGMEMKKRIPYTSTPNLLIANIMKEVGHYFAINMSIKDAFIAYKIGLYYDPNNQLNIAEDLDQLMPDFKKYEFKETIFEEKFHPALAFTKNNQQDFTQKTSGIPSLFWRAGLAFSLLLLIASRMIWIHCKG